MPISFHGGGRGRAARFAAARRRGTLPTYILLICKRRSQPGLSVAITDGRLLHQELGLPGCAPARWYLIGQGATGGRRRRIGCTGRQRAEAVLLWMAVARRVAFCVFGHFVDRHKSRALSANQNVGRMDFTYHPCWARLAQRAAYAAFYPAVAPLDGFCQFCGPSKAKTRHFNLRMYGDSVMNRDNVLAQHFAETCAPMARKQIDNQRQ